MNASRWIGLNGKADCIDVTRSIIDGRHIFQTCVQVNVKFTDALENVTSEPNFYIKRMMNKAIISAIIYLSHVWSFYLDQNRGHE